MNINKYLLTAAVATFGAQLLTATSALAQEDESSALDEITVSAQRREQSIQDTPISVSAFSGERLSELGLNDPKALLDYVPNAMVSSGTGRGGEVAQFSIRGVNEARISPVLDPGVAIYIDDIYFGRPQVGFLQFLDVERVEVLRGPQGTLFGKNSTGGAIRYITVKPDLDGNSGYADLTVGDYNRINVKGAFNVVLSDSTAVRISAASMERDGYVKRLADKVALGDQDARAFSLQLRHQPNDRLTMDFRVDNSISSDNNGAVKLIDYYNFNTTTDLPNPGGPPNPASPSSSAIAAWNNQWGGTAMEYAAEIPRSLYEVAGTGLVPWTDNESNGAAFDLSYDISDSITLRSITGWRDMSSTAFRDPDDVAHATTFFDDYAKTHMNFWSQEFQLSGETENGKLNWVTGVFYSQEENGVTEFADRDGRSTSRYGALMLNDDSLQKTDSLGVFAQGTFSFTDAFALTLGVRYSEDDKNYTVSQAAIWDHHLDQLADELGLADLVAPTYEGGTCDPSVQDSCVSNAGVSGGDTFDAVTPRVALEFHATEEVMLYASYSGGFKAGGTNDSTRDIDTPFDEETLNSTELGIRATFFDGRVRANLTAFSMDYQDKQITVTTAPECNNRCTTNVGDGKITGWEFDGMAALGDNVIWTLGVGILDAEWDDISNPSAGVTKSSPFSAAPDLTWNTGLRFTADLSGGSSIVTSLDYSYTDEHATSPQDSTTFYMPEYDLFNFRVKWISSDGGYEFSVFCSNCADEEYARAGNGWAGGTDNTFWDFKGSDTPPFTANTQDPRRNAAPGISIVHVGAPRMIGAQFRYNFGN
jgi:iron complex outermembrane receptor protein